MTQRSSLLAFFLAMALLVVPARAQEATDPVPRNEDAELVFEQGLDAFEAGDYGMAYRRFRLVYSSYPLHRKTTAAALMAGKALYRQGDLDEATEILNALFREYPTSHYLDEARETLRIIEMQRRQESMRASVIDVGIALPLSGGSALLSQAMFDGIRAAVEEHNGQPGQRNLLRMVFRDSGNRADRAEQAVAELVGDGVDVILGPLYSEEARAAAGAAEASEIVLVAPLATDEAVSKDRDFVFQANPTIEMRGRLMARFAVRNLRINDFGIVAAQDNQEISERMAEGFQDEALQEGANVHFYAVLPSARYWGRLETELGRDTLANTRALYLAVTGSQSDAYALNAISSLDRMNADVRVLGSSEWHNLQAPVQLSNYTTTYTNDFYVEPNAPGAQAFAQRFQAMTGEPLRALSFTAQRLAYTGYDLMRYLTIHLTGRGDQTLREALQSAAPYQGIGLRIDFQGGNVNQAMYYQRYRSGDIELLR